MKTDALVLIANERERQIAEEGYTLDHDDEHHENELPLAAAAYAEHVGSRQWLFGDMPENYVGDEAPDCWPWEESAWKPKDPLRDLVRAGALIVAAIERLQRLGNKAHPIEIEE